MISIMENRSEIVRELFDLRVLLNKSNIVANEKTELVFYIIEPKINNDSVQFIARLKGSHNQSLVVLAEKVRKDIWKMSKFHHFYYLREFCVKELNTKTEELKVLVKYGNQMNTLLNDHMNKIFRNLGIQKSK